MHVGEELDEVFAQAVGAVFEGVDGEEGDHVEVELAGLVEDEVEARVRRGCGGADDGLVAGPLAVEGFEFATADLVAGVIRNGDADGSNRGAGGFGAGGADVGGEAIFCAGLDAHAAKASVVEGIAGRVDADVEVVGVAGVEWGIGVDA